MSDKIIAWLLQKVSGAEPGTVLEAGAVGVHVASLAELVSALRAANGPVQLYGMQTSADVVVRARNEVLPSAEKALLTWRDRLATEHGEEGAQAFRSIALRYGIALDHVPPLRRDDAIAEALSMLFVALDDFPRATRNARAAGQFALGDDEELAYFVERRSDPVGFAQLGIGSVAPSIEGLFAELDELNIGGSRHGGRSGECQHSCRMRFQTVACS